MAEQLAFNIDCMEAMKEFPDKFFDLAVVDPPYGGGFTEGGGCQGWFSKYHQDNKEQENHELGVHFHGRGRSKKYAEIHSQPDNGSKQPLRFHDGRWSKYLNDSPERGYVDGVQKKIIAWDVAPGPEYFDELFRVSKNQIIWGGNYFELPPTRCFLIWRKLTISEQFTMAMAEYAWTSFNENAKVFEAAPQDPTRFHPTQKPVNLYAWIYKNYAKEGYKILDTHLGSGSSRVAAYDAGLDFWGYEIDKTYFDLQEERFAKHTAQMNLFLMEE